MKAEDVEFMDLYIKHVKVEKVEEDRVKVTCIKGLWSVEGPDFWTALSEGQRYFRQYYHDGEYDN